MSGTAEIAKTFVEAAKNEALAYVLSVVCFSAPGFLWLFDAEFTETVKLWCAVSAAVGFALLAAPTIVKIVRESEEVEARMKEEQKRVDLLTGLDETTVSWMVHNMFSLESYTFVPNRWLARNDIAYGRTLESCGLGTVTEEDADRHTKHYSLVLHAEVVSMLNDHEKVKERFRPLVDELRERRTTESFTPPEY